MSRNQNATDSMFIKQFLLTSSPKEMFSPLKSNMGKHFGVVRQPNLISEQVVSIRTKKKSPHEHILKTLILQLFTKLCAHVCVHRNLKGNCYIKEWHIKGTITAI